MRVIGGQIGQFVQRKRAEERVQYLAAHDALTGLPNRVMFAELLNHEIKAAQRYKRTFAVMFIDLDRFKFVNDTLGHEAGDKLLQEIAARFKACLRASDVVARLGGDEFVVLLQEARNQEDVASVARKLLAAAMKPVSVMGQECRVTASIGICMHPGVAQDEPTLMKNADIAMYLAKEQGKNNFQFFSEDIKTRSLARLTLESSPAPRAWSATSSRCTTRPSSTSGRKPSPAWRRCCAGSTPSSAWCRRRSSSRSPRKPG